MSDMETHKGKLIPICNFGDTLEERAEAACNQFGFQKAEWHDSWLECLRDEGYRKVYIHNGVVYEVHDEELDSCGFAEATENEDGSIDYFISYYNGGAGFDEVLNAAIK